MRLGDDSEGSNGNLERDVWAVRIDPAVRALGEFKKQVAGRFNEGNYHMIQQFIERFNAGSDQLRERFAAAHPDDYDDIVRAVVEVIANPDGYDQPDPERITTIDHGDYQGTLLYVIGADGYQPSTYWAVDVGYGSCSGCDTLQDIHAYSSEPPTPEQVKGYMTLALHIVQEIRQIAGYGMEGTNT